MRQSLRQILVVLIIVVVAVIGTLSFSGQAQPASKVTWEYKVISMYGPSETEPPPSVARLDKAGLEGWELIDIKVGSSSRPSTPAVMQVRTDYYFKRAK